MSSRLVGKPSPLRLKRLLRNSLGAESNRVLVGPGPGLDAAVIDLGDGRVMAIAEDPIFPAPKLPLEIMGRFTVHIGASDVAVTGVRPEFMTYTLLSPGLASEKDVRTIVESISETAKSLGITIVGGHTGWYDAVNIPIVGGVTVWGFATESEWISPGGARDGDVLLLTKGPAIEAAALLGVLYRDRLEKELGAEVLDRLCARTDQITVVEDAQIAFAAGGIHAMHDATEGGVLGGLWEMACASGLRIQADLDPVPVPDDIARLAEALAFDPWQAISEGTLLAAVEPGAVEKVTDAWRKAGIDGFAIGEFHRDDAPSIFRREGETFELMEPEQDPFWDLFFAGLTNQDT